MLSCNAAVEAFCAACPFFALQPVLAVSPLGGGLVNFVYRLQLEHGSAILKYYPPFLASSPGFPFSQQRYFVEKRALQMLQPLLKGAGAVQVPAVLFADDDAFVLVMEDIGEAVPLLKLLSNDGPLASEAVAALASALAQQLVQFGRTVAELTPQLSAADRALFANEPLWAILNSILPATCRAQAERCGMLQELQPLLDDGLELKAPPDSVLIYGDLWPNSVLYNVSTETVWVIDWECCRLSHASSDVDQMLCNLWIMRQNPVVFHNTAIAALMAGLQQQFYGDAVGDWRLRSGQTSRRAFLVWVLTLLKEEHWRLESPVPVLRKALEETGYPLPTS